MQSLPGVSTLSDFSAGLYVRGGSPDQNLILLDDIDVYNPSHLFGFFSTFNVDAVKTVDLQKSGLPARYGGRLSSLLDVHNRDGNRKQPRGRRPAEHHRLERHAGGAVAEGLLDGLGPAHLHRAAGPRRRRSTFRTSSTTSTAKFNYDVGDERPRPA